MFWYKLFISVAEPPLFWAAPAPDVRGPGADSGPKKGGSIQKRAALGSSGYWTKIIILSSEIFNFNKSFGSYLSYTGTLNWLHVYTLLFSFPIRFSRSRSRLNKVAPALGTKRNVNDPHTGNQCCGSGGSGMIYSGSGSSFEFSEFRIRIQPIGTVLIKYISKLYKNTP